jgi:hypothetical protein
MIAITPVPVVSISPGLGSLIGVEGASALEVTVRALLLLEEPELSTYLPVKPLDFFASSVLDGVPLALK